MPSRWGYTHEAASPCLDNLLFKPISKQLLGSRIRLAVSGEQPTLVGAALKRSAACLALGPHRCPPDCLRSWRRSAG